MDQFMYDAEDAPVLDPMEVYRLGQPSVQPPFPATEPLATFDLTPASGDGMVFNLTPVPGQV